MKWPSNMQILPPEVTEMIFPGMNSCFIEINNIQKRSTLYYSYWKPPQRRPNWLWPHQESIKSWNRPRRCSFSSPQYIVHLMYRKMQGLVWYFKDVHVEIALGFYGRKLSQREFRTCMGTAPLLTPCQPFLVLQSSHQQWPWNKVARGVLWMLYVLVQSPCLLNKRM